jgi:hypothetical protein
MALSAAILAAEGAFLYVTHLARLRGGAMEKLAQDVWLRPGYLQPGDGILAWLARQTFSVFRFIFSAGGAAAVGLVLASGAILWLAVRREPAALLLGAPFVLAAAGGLLRLYPYAGTRHSADLALFACAAVGLSLAPVADRRPWILLVLALLLAPAAFVVGSGRLT